MVDHVSIDNVPVNNTRSIRFVNTSDKLQSTTKPRVNSYLRLRLGK